MRKAALSLLLLLLILPVAQAQVYYFYDCEDNTIGNSNFSGTGLSCVSNPALNGSYSLQMTGSGTYSSMNYSYLSLPANYNISFWTNGSGATVPTGGPQLICSSQTDVANGCWTAGSGSGVAYDDSRDPNFQILHTGGSGGGDITVPTYWRYEQVGGTLSIYNSTGLVASVAKTPAYLQFAVNVASYTFWVDDLCIYTGDGTDCYPTPPLGFNTVTLTLSDNVTGSSIGSNVKFSNVTGELTFTYFNVTASGFCVTYTGNGTGTNCTTSGSGTSTYYNVTTTQNITGTQSVSEDTYQALLAVRSTRLYLNTTITSFNVTNNKARNTTTSGLVFLKASNGSNNVMVDAAGNYSKNATATVVSPFTITNLTVTGIYDNLFTFKANDLINGGLVSNFTIVAENATVATVTDTTTTRNVTLQLLQGYDYIAQFQSSTHAWQNVTLPANASTNTYTFNAYTINSVNFSFYDEDTNTLITQLVTLEYIGDTESGNASTTSGHLYLDLLTPDTYTLRYNSAGYTQRFYELTIRNTTFTALNLTLLNATMSTNVTLTVRDTLDNLIEGAVVKILKYNLADNDYDITQIVTTNFEGVALADIELNTEYYRFIVEYNGEVVLSTNPSYIYGTSLTLIVDLIADSGFQNAETYYGYSGSITYLNTTEQLRFTYNDDTNTASKGCLYLYKLTSTRTLYNTSCSSSSSGTVYVTVRNSTGLYWQAEGYITDSGGTSHLVDSYTLSFRRLLPETGNGLFLMLLVLMVFGLIGVWRVDVAVLLGSLTPLLFTIIGFIQLDYVYTVPIFVLGVVTALILAVKQ